MLIHALHDGFKLVLVHCQDIWRDELLLQLVHHLDIRLATDIGFNLSLIHSTCRTRKRNLEDTDADSLITDTSSHQLRVENFSEQQKIVSAFPMELMALQEVSGGWKYGAFGCQHSLSVDNDVVISRISLLGLLLGFALFFVVGHFDCSSLLLVMLLFFLIFLLIGSKVGWF